MKRLRRLVLGCVGAVLAFVSPAYSEGKFDGPFAQFTIGLASYDTQLSTADNGGVAIRYGRDTVFNTFSVGYSHGFGAWNSQWNMGLNAFWTKNGGLTSRQKAKIYGQSSSSFQNQIIIDNTYGVVFEPGYYVRDNALTYLKLGWAQVSSRYEGLSSSEGNYLIDFKTSNGLLYGFGVKILALKRWFVGIEAYQILFAGKKVPGEEAVVDNKLSFMQAGVVVGYVF